MEVRAQLEGDDIGVKIKRKMDKLGNVVREAMRESAQEMADAILFRGAEDIEEAGNFGSDWQEALHADITETQRTIRVDAYMKADEEPVKYWRVFEHGATIFAHNDRGLLTWPNKSGFSINGVVPAFISKPSVTIPKKFHLTEIIKDEAKKARANFAKLLEEMKTNG
jgi:hypothetical protein